MDKDPVFKNILFLTDGSAPSLLAQELTVDLAKKMNAKVTVFHVVTHELMSPIVQDFLVQGRGIPESADSEPGLVVESEVSLGRKTPTSSGAHYGETVEGEITSVYHEQGEDIVADSAQTLKGEGIQVARKVVDSKSVAKAVMNEIEREDYDLIVMGRNGQKQKEAHLGSVVEKVVRHVDISVLVAGEKGTISKLLVPLDGSEVSKKALRAAAALSRRLEAPMTLLHVQESHLFSMRPDVTKAIGNAILADAAMMIKETKFDQKLASGHPARVIADIAAKDNYDTIAIGGTGHGDTGKTSLGSVTNHVLHYTRRAILIVK